MDEETAEQLQTVAREAVEKIENAQNAQAIKELVALEGIDEALALKLVDHGIKSGEDLAEQATDDLTSIGLG